VYEAAEDGIPPHETNFHFVLLQSKPAERRARLVGGWEYRPGAQWRATLRAGYERVRNFDFVQSADRNNFLANLSIDWFKL
jgi:hypothetical protein